MLEFRDGTEGDAEAIWQMFCQVVQAGQAFFQEEAVSRTQIITLWLTNPVKTTVALMDQEAVGAYMIQPNYAGRGSHVANATYMVKAAWRGKGIGRAMGEHSLAQAKEMGFLAMQFNAVVSTNEAAVSLWKSLGFSIVGTIPQAYRDKELGLVDMYVMHRFL